MWGREEAHGQSSLARPLPLSPDFAKCVFPFWFRRMIYWNCTQDGNDFGKKWCSLTQNFNKDQLWKYC